MLARAVTIYTKIGRNVDIGLRLIWSKTSPTICPVTLQHGYEEFPTMHGIDLLGGAAANVPVNLGEPCALFAYPDRARSPSACAGRAHGRGLAAKMLLTGIGHGE
jgi:hypothetical protein